MSDGVMASVLSCGAPHAAADDVVVYFVAMVGTGLVKVGATGNTLQRFTALRNEHKRAACATGVEARDLVLLGTTPGYMTLEGLLHRAYDDVRASSEEAAAYALPYWWEWFRLPRRDVALVKAHATQPQLSTRHWAMGWCQQCGQAFVGGRNSTALCSKRCYLRERRRRLRLPPVAA